MPYRLIEAHSFNSLTDNRLRGLDRLLTAVPYEDPSAVRIFANRWQVEVCQQLGIRCYVEHLFEAFEGTDDLLSWLSRNGRQAIIASTRDDLADIEVRFQQGTSGDLSTNRDTAISVDAARISEYLSSSSASPVTVVLDSLGDLSLRMAGRAEEPASNVRVGRWNCHVQFEDGSEVRAHNMLQPILGYEARPGETFYDWAYRIGSAHREAQGPRNPGVPPTRPIKRRIPE